MQSTSSEPSPASSIIRTGIDGQLRYSREQRQDLLEAFDRSGLSAMSFSRQHGVSYQTFIAWVRKRRECGDILLPNAPAFAEVICKRSIEHLSHFRQSSGSYGIYATRLSMIWLAAGRVLMQLAGSREWGHCSRINTIGLVAPDGSSTTALKFSEFYDWNLMGKERPADNMS